MGRRTTAGIRHARGWTTEDRRPLRTPLEVKAERARKRRAIDVENPIMKALGIKESPPVRRAAKHSRVVRETQGINVMRERAVHLLVVKRVSPFKSMETTRSEMREGRVKENRQIECRGGGRSCLCLKGRGELLQVGSPQLAQVGGLCVRGSRIDRSSRTVSCRKRPYPHLPTF